MSADEWESWKAYDATSPIGPLRADLRAAIVAQTVATCQGAKVKRTDFMPFYEPPKPTEEEIGDSVIAWAKAMKAAMDAKLRRKRNGK